MTTTSIISSGEDNGEFRATVNKSKFGSRDEGLRHATGLFSRFLKKVGRLRPRCDTSASHKERSPDQRGMQGLSRGNCPQMIHGRVQNLKTESPKT